MTSTVSESRGWSLTADLFGLSRIANRNSSLSRYRFCRFSAVDLVEPHADISIKFKVQRVPRNATSPLQLLAIAIKLQPHPSHCTTTHKLTFRLNFTFKLSTGTATATTTLLTIAPCSCSCSCIRSCTRTRLRNHDHNGKHGRVASAPQPRLVEQQTKGLEDYRRHLP